MGRVLPSHTDADREMSPMWCPLQEESRAGGTLMAEGPAGVSEAASLLARGCHGDALLQSPELMIIVIYYFNLALILLWGVG